MAGVQFILGSRLVQWLLLVAVVVLVIRFVPYDWVATSDQKRVDAIGQATESMMPSDLGYALGQAAAKAFSCAYEFDKSGAEIALGTHNFEYRFIEPGGMLQGVYNDGYQAADTSGAPPAGYCDGALAEFGPTGSIIPTLIRNR